LFYELPAVFHHLFLAQLNQLNLTPAAVVWSIGAVTVGLICGFALGGGYAMYRAPRKLKEEKARTLQCLLEIVQSAEQLNADVDSHNTQLRDVKSSVDEIRDREDVNVVQKQLFSQIQAMVESNRRLENDLIVSQYKLQQRAQELDHSRREARVDNLSGLANRRAFDEALQYFWSSAQRRNRKFGLVLIDVDHFKRINDTYGHLAGDRVVQKIGDVLKQCVRGEDVVSRLGGDEFAVILKGVGDGECRQSAIRIRSAIERTNFEFDDSISSTSVTISLGLAVFRPNESKESLMDRADKALYRSKELGRNLAHAWTDNEAIVNILQ
jgi:diguanylate cyclase